MAQIRQYLLAPSGSTGNITGSGIQVFGGREVALQLVVEAIGATPTVTFKFQGSLDGLTWADVPYVTEASNTEATTGITVTGLGASRVFVPLRLNVLQFFRVVTSANTNVTFRAEAYGNDG